MNPRARIKKLEAQKNRAGQTWKEFVESAEAAGITPEWEAFVNARMAEAGEITVNWDADYQPNPGEIVLSWDDEPGEKLDGT